MMLNKNTWACTSCGKAGKWVDCEVCLCEDKKVASMIRLTMSPSLLSQPMSQSITSSSSVSMESEGAGPSNIIIANNNIISPPDVAMSSSSVGGKRLSCNKCDVVCKNIYFLNKHKNQYHRNEMIADGLLLPCPHCTRTFEGSRKGNALATHIRTKHSDQAVATTRREDEATDVPMKKKVTIRIFHLNTYEQREIKPSRKIDSILLGINNEYGRVGKLYKNGRDISQLVRFKDCDLQDNDMLEYIA